MENENKCYICGRPGQHELDITIDNGGKLHEFAEKEKTYLCSLHWKEFQAIKKKRRPRDDFH